MYELRIHCYLWGPIVFSKLRLDCGDVHTVLDHAVCHPMKAVNGSVSRRLRITPSTHLASLCHILKFCASATVLYLVPITNVKVASLFTYDSSDSTSTWQFPVKSYCRYFGINSRYICCNLHIFIYSAEIYISCLVRLAVCLIQESTFSSLWYCFQNEETTVFTCKPSHCGSSCQRADWYFFQYKS